MQGKFSQPTLLHNIKGTYHTELVWGFSTSFFLAQIHRVHSKIVAILPVIALGDYSILLYRYNQIYICKSDMQNLRFQIQKEFIM